MLLKLTYYGKSVPTLVNFESVETLYEVYDRKMQRVNTKILFRGGNFINVEENLQTILKLSQEHNSGEYQDTAWISSNIIDKAFEDNFEEQRYERSRERNYNRF